MQMTTMMRDSFLNNWFVMVMILAATLGPYGSYLCVTERGTLQIENVWSGGCLAGTGIYSNSVESLTVIAAKSPCGACTDVRLGLESTLPSGAKTTIHHMSAVDGMAYVCDQSMRSPQGLDAGELTLDPPQDSTLSALRIVVLLI